MPRQKKQELAIMFVDLDRFKFINDVLGHIVGDKVLTQVAKRLESCLRPTDVISRFGGDEFIIFLPNMADGYDGIQAAKRLQEVFSAPFEIDGDEIFINISIGLSRYPSDGKNIVSLLNAADSALQRAKEHGGNNFQQYHSGIVVPHQMHLKLEKQLRKALERGELELHFQPQVTIDGSKVVGCEALVRWNHPELGLMYPDQFISYAEDSGLIIPMGEWVLRDACKSAKQLLDKGSPSFTISVNVSPRQLLQYNLVETVSTILRETGLPAKYLELEITERILMKNIDISIEILTQLKKMGIKISIDDFGTGYASLSYLRKLPVNKIKIDRSFIHGSLKNVQDAAIITAIITIAHQLNLEVIAEGVETKKQLAFLQKNSCDYMQGNLFSKPLSQKEFSALLGKKRKVKKTKAR
jgi:diguanylate cyclase (GGDEF)-like protein